MIELRPLGRVVLAEQHGLVQGRTHDRTLRALEWQHAHVLEGDLSATVSGLKAAFDGNIIVLGRPRRLRLLGVTPTTTGVLMVSCAMVR